MIKYPEHSIFLLCDDIRNEEGKKLSLLGVYAGGDIQVAITPTLNPVSEAPPMLASLAIFVSFLDGLGKCQYRLQLEDPDGKHLIPDGPAQSAEKLHEGSMNVIAKWVPFPIKIGKYTFTVFLDERPYRWIFEIKKVTSAQSPGRGISGGPTSGAPISGGPH
jgi:hypothetical protein